MISGAAPRGPPIAPASPFLPLQYQSIPVNKSSAGSSPLSLHSYSYFRMLLERTAKCQDLYKVNISPNVTGRVEEGGGGETTSLLASVSHCQNCEPPTLGRE